jgi:2'-5' RNA ligase
MLYSNQLPVFEYNLRITPPDPVYSQIVNMKSEFIRYFGPGLYSKSSPHITIASFCMNAMHEAKLLKHLHNTLTHEHFPVSLKQVSGFNDIRMVVVDLAQNQVLRTQIAGLQKTFRQELRIPSKHASVVDRFHITIGQASNSLDYGKAIQLLNTLPLDWDFNCSGFVLVKRPFGKPVSWQACHIFQLEKQEEIMV